MPVTDPILNMACGVCAAFSLASATQADDPFFLQLPFLPNSFEVGSAGAVSADGRFVAGDDATTVNSYGELVRWTEIEPGMATVEALGVPPWAPNGVTPVAISDDGLVIASFGLDILGAGVMATRWADPDAGGPGFTALGVLDGPYPDDSSNATAMSADGSVIVGEATSIDFGDGSTFRQAFVWHLTDHATGEGVMSALPLLDGDEQGRANGITADANIIVGFSGALGQHLAVRWVDEIPEPLGALEKGGLSSASAVSPNGEYIVGIATLDGFNVPFRWTERTGMQALEQPPHAAFAGAGAVSDDGVAIGAQNGVNGAVWTPDGQGHDISAWLLSEFGLDTSDWKTISPFKISGDGRTIVGRGDLGVPAEAPWLAFLGDACAADVNGDGVLNVLDFVAFQLLWQDGDPAADCDANGAFNVLDFVCFQQVFQNSCE